MPAERITDPRIHLGIDNCFAIKRWTEPCEWGKVIGEMGLQYVEAVPDLECEPLLNPADYRRDWTEKVNRLREETGIRVVMFYSNDSTYDSIGFSHPDGRIRRHFVENWFGNFIEMASAIGSDIGYYVQATPESMLYSAEGRREAASRAYECIVRVNRMAGDAGIRHVALEQMYTPHQPPFRIADMRSLIVNVTRDSGVPFFLTEDVGHHCPFYRVPTDEALRAGAARFARDGFVAPWLGSREAYDLFTRFAAKGSLTGGEIAALREDFARNADQFNAPEDTDCYAWLRKLGCWSPVIHMQQTDGTHSSHAPFLPENNASGKIHPVRVLRALAEAYANADRTGMPEVCEDIYLIQELYLSTKDIGYQGLHKLRTSTDYLRRYIPRDGMRLSELLSLNAAEAL